MNITSFFADILNAPVVNKMWSWGAENKETETLFLRAAYMNIIETERRSKNDIRMKVQMTYGTASHGETERARHIADIQNGKAAYVVMLHGKENQNGVFKIDSFDSERVWPIEELVYDCQSKVYYAWLAMPVNVSSLTEE